VAEYRYERRDSSLRFTSETNDTLPALSAFNLSDKRYAHKRNGNLVIDTFQRNPRKEVETAVSSMVVQERNSFSRRRKKGNPIFSRKVRDASRGNYDQRKIGCVE
jgi:hypothetical protein